MARELLSNNGGSEKPKFYDLQDLNSIKDFISKYGLTSGELQSWVNKNVANIGMGNSATKEIMQYLEDYYLQRQSAIYEGLNNGSMSGQQALDEYNRLGLSYVDPSMSDTIQQHISQDNSQTAFDREIAARDSSVTSTAQQLQELGLNPGSVLQIGGSALPNVAQATTPQLNAAKLAQQERMNQYNQKQAMTRQLISMVASLGRAAIGGTTYGLARTAAIQAVRGTAGAAKAALSSNYGKFSQKEWDESLAQLGY